MFLPSLQEGGEVLSYTAEGAVVYAVFYLYGRKQQEAPYECACASHFFAVDFSIQKNISTVEVVTLWPDT